MPTGDAPQAAAATIGSVKVVGPCKSGKSVLAAALRARGFSAGTAAQEHSGVPTMWRQMDPPEWLIYLDVSVEEMRARSGRSDWTDAILADQHRRLENARQHADLTIDTSGLEKEEVLARSLAFLAQKRADI